MDNSIHDYYKDARATKSIIVWKSSLNSKLRLTFTFHEIWTEWYIFLFIALIIAETISSHFCLFLLIFIMQN